MRSYAITLMASAFVLGACGGGDNTATTDTTMAAAPAADTAMVAAPAGTAMPITGQTIEVHMIGDEKGYRYEPNEITLKAGDGIKFVMVSGAPHNVAFDPATLPANVAAQLTANMPDQIAPLSVELLKKGESALAAGKLIEADDAFETALAVDPRNRAAFVSMARVAMKQRLFGQAIRMTNKALALEPTDKEALALQGQAMVEQGAAARAKDVLANLQKLCTSGCPQAAELSAAIARGPSLAQAKPPATPKTN